MQSWFKNSQTRLAVRNAVGEVLDEYLPEESMTGSCLSKNAIKRLS